jgi:hypothetical protein
MLEIAFNTFNYIELWFDDNLWALEYVYEMWMSYVFGWFQMSWDLCSQDVFGKKLRSIQYYIIHMCMIAWSWWVCKMMSMSMEQNYERWT